MKSRVIEAHGLEGVSRDTRVLRDLACGVLVGAHMSQELT